MVLKNRMADLLMILNNLVNQSVLFGFGRSEVEITVRVFLDFLNRLTGVLGQNVIYLVFNFDDLASGDFDFHGLTFGAAHHLV